MQGPLVKRTDTPLVGQSHCSKTIILDSSTFRFLQLDHSCGHLFQSPTSGGIPGSGMTGGSEQVWLLILDSSPCDSLGRGRCRVTDSEALAALAHSGWNSRGEVSLYSLVGQSLLVHRMNSSQPAKCAIPLQSSDRDEGVGQNTSNTPGCFKQVASQLW